MTELGLKSGDYWVVQLFEAAVYTYDTISEPVNSSINKNSSDSQVIMYVCNAVNHYDINTSA